MEASVEKLAHNDDDRCNNEFSESSWDGERKEIHLGSTGKVRECNLGASDVISTNTATISADNDNKRISEREKFKEVDKAKLFCDGKRKLVEVKIVNKTICIGDNIHKSKSSNMRRLVWQNFPVLE